MISEVINGDCRTVLDRELESIRRKPDLIFADPPFNIGYEYDVYSDNKSLGEYIRFTEEWMYVCSDNLSENGSIWIAAPDEYVHRFRVLAEDSIGLNFVAHVIWHYTFGMHRKRGFSRSHAHLLHYSKSKEYTWNGDDIKVPSWRMLNGDKRAALGGRYPDDTWQYPRICGTHKERVGWHKCQMPESLMARIIRVSSNPRDLVIDPFSGSGTTGAVCKKLDRDFIGIELSSDYTEKSIERIHGCSIGDPIQGLPRNEFPIDK